MATQRTPKQIAKTQKAILRAIKDRRAQLASAKQPALDHELVKAA